MQVNPHFLFNALNNIYSLAVMEKGPKTADSVIKLSEMMRYLLYEKEDSSNRVSLDKEIRQINNYIDLEKLRHANGFHFNFSIEGDTGGKRIAPLLLFPLVENSFKHGVLSDSVHPVNIELKTTEDHIAFNLQNLKNDSQKDEAGGIGILNVKKRLDLIYGDDYTFNINEDDRVFAVNLTLPL